MQSNTFETKEYTFREFLNRAILTMGVGLLLSAAVAWSTSNLLLKGYMIHSFRILMLIACVAEVGLSFYFSTRIMRMSKATAWSLFIAYSALTGFTLSSILIVYNLGSVFMAFGTTAVLFVCMAIIGHTTNVDLSRFSTLLMFGLIGMIVVSLLNVFLFHSSMMNLILTYFGIILFLALIAYDMQRLKHLYSSSYYDYEMSEKLIILGALELYLDFVNLFIRILQMFGRRRD